MWRSQNRSSLRQIEDFVRSSWLQLAYLSDVEQFYFIYLFIFFFWLPLYTVAGVTGIADTTVFCFLEPLHPFVPSSAFTSISSSFLRLQGSSFVSCGCSFSPSGVLVCVCGFLLFFFLLLLLLLLLPLNLFLLHLLFFRLLGQGAKVVTD